MDKAGVADGKDHHVTQLMQARLAMSVHGLVSHIPAIDLGDKLQNYQVLQHVTDWEGAYSQTPFFSLALMSG